MNKRDVMALMRGQGATEYLVLLAVVLIVALVAVTLLGFFPGIAPDVKITQSQTYWRGQVRPFAILETSIVGSTGVGIFVIQNMEANGPYRLTTFAVGNGTNDSLAVDFAAGETKTIGIITNTGTAGALYDLNVTMIYTTPAGINNTRQYGTKNLIGKYG